MILRASYKRPDRSLKPEEAAEICFQCGVCCVVKGHSCHVMYDQENFDSKYTYVYDCLGAKDPAQNPNIWLCVSCHKCEEMCPYEVSPVSFIESAKSQAFERGLAHQITVSEVEQVLSTGYAFPLTPSAARTRGELDLDAIHEIATDDLKRIAKEATMASKLLCNKELRD